jgi:hypothetical protein
MWFCKRKIGILTIDAKFSNELIQYLVQHKILSNSLLMKAKINVNNLPPLTPVTNETSHNRYDDQRQEPTFMRHQDPQHIEMTRHRQQHQHHLPYSNNHQQIPDLYQPQYQQQYHQYQHPQQQLSPSNVRGNNRRDFPRSLPSRTYLDPMPQSQQHLQSELHQMTSNSGQFPQSFHSTRSHSINTILNNNITNNHIHNLDPFSY